MHALAPSVPADVRALLGSLGIEAPPSHGPTPRRPPERVLGQALSLPETVRLEDGLSAAASDGEGRAELDGAALVAQTEQRLGQLRQRIDRCYAEAFQDKGAPPEPARLRARAHAELLANLLAAIQREIELLKQSVRTSLQRASSAPPRLLALDKLVDPVITREVREAHRSLVRAYEQRCAAQLEAAGADGVPGPLLDDARRLTHALLDLEWAAVQGLVDALCLEPAR